jgi:hypothetical protein
LQSPSRAITLVVRDPRAAFPMSLWSCSAHFLGRTTPLVAQKIYQGLERWPHLAAARIIKKKSCRRSWRPLVENGHKSAFGKIRCDEDGRALYEPKAFDSGTACDRH